MLISFNIKAQESLISLFNNKLELADEYYLSGDYHRALKLYEDLKNNQQLTTNINLRLARTYYFTHFYEKASMYYETYQKSNKLSQEDLFYYAESLTASSNYQGAAKLYEEAYKKNPSSEMLAARLWRMNNIDYLYEDTLENAVKYISINTESSELQALPYGEGVLFVTNQNIPSLVKKFDNKSGDSFYQLFYAGARIDPFDINALIYDNLEYFPAKIGGDFHIGPIALFDGQSKMIFSMTSKYANKAGEYPLQLYFAERKNKKWRIKESYPFNDIAFSLTDPWISENGQHLYFSSDMPDGFGGKDIYYSFKSDSGWTKPHNVGEAINTPSDEVFPFMGNDSILYFSSNGHPGMGGFDLFKVQKSGDYYGELENMGYPINSGYDELSITIDSLNRHGFLSSNRKNGGFDDDIYEFDLGLQTYPLEVSGQVKFIEHNWMDSSQLEPLPHVKLILIDNRGDKRILETVSDHKGEFKFIIPYYSQFKIRIVGDDLDGIVSFEVPKYAKTNDKYEIVVVNDDFKKPK